MLELLQAIGFSAPAGLNAYLTLLLVGLAGRFGLVDLTGTWGDRLTNPYVLGALVLLTAWEIAVDKIPGADNLNDIVGTVVRPLSGAVLMLVTPNPLAEEQPVAAITLGAGLAGLVHVLKSVVRPFVTVSTAGFGTPVVSAAEDTAAVGTVLIALVVPALILVLLIGVAAFSWWVFVRWRRRRSARGFSGSDFD
ncbi:MAG: DUF4126 domain-containing protein [Dehalococcoidia bacterium]